MRLGFYYHIPAFRDADSRIRMPGYLGRFIDSLATRCDSVVCFMHLPGAGDDSGDYALESPKVDLVSLPLKGTVPHRALHSGSMTAPLLPFRERLDVMLIRGPSPLLSQAARAVRPVPVALLLVGDYVAGVGTLPQPRWRKELIRIWSLWNRRCQDKVAARSLVFVNTRVLYEEYRHKTRHLVETRTTTLSGQDFVLRDDACASPPYRVLYTGRLDSAKGLMDIAEAVKVMRDSGYEVVFDLVGWPQKGDDVLERLRSFAETHNIRLAYHGFKAVGPELFQFYREADMHVVASRGSEGFPRTIWEAMAHSLPVVATEVGSIPHYLRNERDALLVKPRDPLALADAMARLIENRGLRSNLVANGRVLAAKNTLDKCADELIAELKEWCCASL